MATTPAVPLRLVLFGLPAAGKSSLLGALSQAALSQGDLLQGKLLDQAPDTNNLATLRHHLYDHSPQRTEQEVQPYAVSYAPTNQDSEAPEPDLQAVLIDCDGRVADDMMTKGQGLPDRAAPDTLPGAVSEADALILVVDSSADDQRLETDFAEFSTFLDHLEVRRGRHTDIAGLPVFLVLTKCDLLAKPKDTSTDWIEHIEERKREVGDKFRAFLSDRNPGFGQLDLRVWATAVKRPALYRMPARPNEPYGVAELFRECLSEAADYRRRAEGSRVRLAWTIGVSLVTVAAMLLLVVWLLLTNQRPGELQRRIEAFRAALGVRVEDRLRGTPEELRSRLEFLQQFEADPGFRFLPIDERDYVEARVKELTAYIPYLEAVLGAGRPADAGSEDTLERIRKHLEQAHDSFQPPPSWGPSEASHLIEDRLKDVEALTHAADRVKNWYESRGQTILDLLLFTDLLRPTVQWRPWADRVAAVLQNGADARSPADFDYSALVPDAASRLDYFTVQEYRVVRAARQDWSRTRSQLEQLRDIAAAMGLIDAGPDFPATLKLNDRMTLERLAQRAEQLEKYYPRHRTDFTIPADVPDEVRAQISGEALVDFGYLLGPKDDYSKGPAREYLLHRFFREGETAERWAALRAWLKDPVELKDWRTVAAALTQLVNPQPTDPIDDLVRFLAPTSKHLR